MKQDVVLLSNVRVLRDSDFDVGTQTVKWTMPPVTEILPTLAVKKLQSKDGAPDIMIVGDSFSGHLQPFFDATFKSVTLKFNSDPFPLEGIRQQRPILVVYELAERLLVHR